MKEWVDAHAADSRAGPWRGLYVQLTGGKETCHRPPQPLPVTAIWVDL